MKCLACSRNSDCFGKPYAGGYCCEECWLFDGCPSEETVKQILIKKDLESMVDRINDDSEFNKKIDKVIKEQNSSIRCSNYNSKEISISNDVKDKDGINYSWCLCEECSEVFITEQQLNEYTKNKSNF